MYKQLLMIGILVNCNLVADSADYNSGQGEQNKKTGIIAGAKKRARAVLGALWTKRSKKARALMAIAAANLLCGMIIMQFCDKEEQQIWPTNCREVLDYQGIISQNKFELSLLKKIANLPPKMLQATLLFPAAGVVMAAKQAGIPEECNLPLRCFNFIQNHLVFKP